uniref:Galactosylgalactosylxylosylprotein 3-beta-glucuronosyltransferase n=1 Tax=Poecilia latipinna TaxID=48699 RepID=A0A3B3U1Y2_9TELE
ISRSLLVSFSVALPVAVCKFTYCANGKQICTIQFHLVSYSCCRRMRSTRGVSVWPVGFVGGRTYERPLVSGGKVVGWYTGWRPDRPFATDMAGFSVNLQVILANPRALFKRRGSQPGMQESDFLKQITKVSELEPKANNCTRVLVWHTRTEKPHLANEPKLKKDTVDIEV